MTENDSFLSQRQRQTLQALCRRMVPHLEEDNLAASEVSDLAAHVEALLATAGPRVPEQMATILTIFDHPALGLMASGRPRRFTQLSADLQDSVLRGWERSRIPARRTIFQSLRRLILSTYYSLPPSHAEIGYLGPYHTRAPRVSHEGPLSGTPSDAEPVARIPSTARPAAYPNIDLAHTRSNQVSQGVTQGKDLSSETTLRADVCVIGTGAGGAVAAATLADAGLEVVMLEEGGYYTAADFTEEEGPRTARLYAEAGMRATDDLSVLISQGRAVGGGTLVNWMIMLRTPDWVLEEWESEHGLSGMGPHEMAPIFDEIEEDIHARMVPEDAHSPNNRILLDGARALGWSRYACKINALECVRAGFCGHGCRYNAKQSMLLTHVPRALNAGARLLSDVRVERIEVLERGGLAPLKLVEARVLDRESGRGRGRVVVKAPIVVVAAGGIETPALLQRSGLASPGTGKFLRFHPTSMVLGRYDREIYAAAGIPLSAVCDEFLRSEDSNYGFWIECPPLHPSLASIAIQGFGKPHRGVMEILPNLGGLICLVRDGADKQRSNGSVSVDRKGRTHIRYRLGPADRRHMAAALKAAARLHLAAGATQAMTVHTNARWLRSETDLDQIDRQSYAPNRFGLFTGHVNGTCRMGTDPATSGCTPDGEVHGVPGLYVADGSLLPTALGVNPQVTIMALSTVISGRIAERHAQRASLESCILRQCP